MRNLSHLPIALLLTLTAATEAHADAEFIIESGDPPGVGLRDNTPTAPVGGNNGATLGEQRRLALEYTAGVWGQLLDSEVPIRVRVTFESLGCGAGGIALANARPWDYFGNFPGAPELNTWYPSPLADRLRRADNDPGAYDITTTVNSDVDDPGCNGGPRWYLGFDHNEGNSFDLVAVMLHELGHGLGSAGLVDLQSGTMPQGAPSMYERLTYDLETSRYWDQMNNGQRVQSSINVRQVVWDGAAVSAAVDQVLDTGTPTFDVSPSIGGFTGAVGAADFGPPLMAPPIVGTLQLGNDGTGDANDGCEPLASLAGNIAVLNRGTCTFLLKVENAQAAGAVGVIITDNQPGGPPPGMTADGPTGQVQIPLVRITLSDGNLLRTSMGQRQVTGTLGIDAGRRAGTAPGGEVYLYAADPVIVGSSISHWDPLASPNLLMEPSITPGLTDDVDLTLPLLRDIGWAPFECGNGVQEPGEQCDSGGSNSDVIADRCRLDCQTPHCGDGVDDTPEGCDDGNLAAGDGCTGACAVEFCGDGLVNDAPNEACDDGGNNSDVAANACRLDCQPAGCGDAVVDAGEACDDGDANSDITPNACRVGCVAPRCGDAVVDDGESCDNGGNNSNVAPNACRLDCQAPRCGDGVTDDGEGCDDGAQNGDAPDSCRAGCIAPACGDGIVDSGEACDDGDANSNDAADSCRLNCALPGCGDALLDDGEVCDDGNLENGDGCDDTCQMEAVVDGGDGDGDGDGDGTGDGSGGAPGDGSSGGGAGDGDTTADGSQGGGDGDSADSSPGSADCRCSVPGARTGGRLPLGWLLAGLALAGARLRRSTTARHHSTARR